MPSYQTCICVDASPAALELCIRLLVSPAECHMDTRRLIFYACKQGCNSHGSGVHIYCWCQCSTCAAHAVHIILQRHTPATYLLHNDSHDHQHAADEIPACMQRSCPPSPAGGDQHTLVQTDAPTPQPHTQHAICAAAPHKVQPAHSSQRQGVCVLQHKTGGCCACCCCGHADSRRSLTIHALSHPSTGGLSTSQQQHIFS